jgi:hypothetical protein
MSCETTVLTGTSGAFYYKPAGTEVCLLATDFPSTGSNIQVGVFQGFRVGDRVTLAYPVGSTTTGAITAGDYYVKTYAADTGVMTISSTEGGSAATATTQPSGFNGNKASIKFKDHQILLQVRDWTFEITRNEIDVTVIGQGTGQYAPFRQFVTGFADGTGTATVYTTDDDTSFASRMIQDVIQRKQLGARVKLYIDQVVSGGSISDTLSRFIESPIVLTSASLGINPDDAQSVSINFRPSGTPTFDLMKS